MSLDAMPSAAPDVPRIEGDEKVFADGRREPLSAYELLERDMADSGTVSDEYTRAGASSAASVDTPGPDVGAAAAPDARPAVATDAGGEAMPPAAHADALQQMKEAKERVLALEQQRTRDQQEIVALLRAMEFKNPETIRTLRATRDAFPLTSSPANEDERAQNERNEQLFAIIAKRRFEIFKDGMRVTDAPTVKEIAQAIDRFQEQPWYVRWGLSGVMGAMGKGAGVAAAGSALAAFATLGAVTSAPISIPATVAFALAAGRYRYVRNRLTSFNERGYGKNPIVFKYQHAVAAVSALAYGVMGYGAAYAALTPGGRLAVQNFFSAVFSKAGATLSQLLSHLSAGKALGAGATVAAGLDA